MKLVTEIVDDFYFFVVPIIEPRASHMVGRHSIFELCFSPKITDILNK
jgi:hypothetical protein